MSDLSDWEVVRSSIQDKAKPQSSSPSDDLSEWQTVAPAQNSYQPQSETFGRAALKAPFRIGEDIYHSIYDFAKNSPNYAQNLISAPRQIGDAIANDPKHALGQLAAGIPEMGHNLINAPASIVDYGVNRLNVLPQSASQNVLRQPDISSDINNTFGTPKNIGEEDLRFLGRNAINLVGATGAARALNPLNLTAKSIANNVVKAEKKQVALHSRAYNKIWNEADQTGFDKVPVNQQLLSNNLGVIEKYKTPREYQSVENFINDPTLQNAQKAQSDLGIIHRSLEEKSRKGSLTSEEKAMYDAAKESEKHIESNMFKNMNGQLNAELQNKYKTLTNSYRENVVPYKYNRDIQAYKNKEMLAKELVNALSRGEFAAKKGSAHPAIKIRNILAPTAKNVGLFGGGAYLLDQMFGNHSGQ